MKNLPDDVQDKMLSIIIYAIEKDEIILAEELRILAEYILEKRTCENCKIVEFCPIATAGGFGDSDSCSKFKPIALKGRE